VRPKLSIGLPNEIKRGLKVVLVVRFSFNPNSTLQGKNFVDHYDAKNERNIKMAYNVGIITIEVRKSGFLARYNYATNYEVYV
jgi:hypothetical protein